MTPILDKSVDPTLRFNYCEGRVQKINRNILTRVGFSIEKAKKFKSSEVTQIKEFWHCSRGVIEAFRSYLATPEDAAAFTCTEFFSYLYLPLVLQQLI